MNYKQYKTIRRDLEKLKETIGFAYNISDRIGMLKTFEDVGNLEVWNKVHSVTGKLWESYCTIDNEINKLDRAINQ